MSNTITGKITHISAVEQVGKNNTDKQFIVIETADQYPDSAVVEAFGDRVNAFTGLSVGDEVTAHFNLRVNEYNGRYYQQVSLWKLEKKGGEF